MHLAGTCIAARLLGWLLLGWLLLGRLRALLLRALLRVALALTLAGRFALLSIFSAGRTHLLTILHRCTHIFAALQGPRELPVSNHDARSAGRWRGADMA